MNQLVTASVEREVSVGEISSSQNQKDLSDRNQGVWGLRSLFSLCRAVSCPVSYPSCWPCFSTMPTVANKLSGHHHSSSKLVTCQLRKEGFSPEASPSKKGV